MVNIAVRNNVKVFGSGSQTIVFAHGFGCDQNMWRFITPTFEKRYKIVLFDYVGSGKSSVEAYNVERYSSLDGYALDLLDVCSHLELKGAIFVGHSVSTMVGVLAGVSKPEIFSKFIFIGPSARYINKDSYYGGFSQEDIDGLIDVMDNNYLGWAAFMAPLIMKNPELPNLASELEESFCAINPDIARKFAEVTFYGDNREDLEKIIAPCLVLQCTDDAIAPEEAGKFVAENLRNSTYIKMKATGHCPHMSHPEETIEQILKFIS